MTKAGAGDDDKESEFARELIESGSDLAGAMTGAALGLLGGPVGVVGGAAAGVAIARVLKRVGADVKQRWLGPREEVRIGAAFTFTAAAIVQALNSGQAPRQDGFFEAVGGQRPAADDLLEGVLLKARDSYQEKKVPLLANLYATIAFHEEISAAHANHLLELASRLTYRQLVAMAVAFDGGNRSRLRQSDYRDDAEAISRLGLDGTGLITEIYDLYQQGLILDTTGSAWISVADVNPGAMRLQGSGAVLGTAMNISGDIPEDDRATIYSLLRS